MRLVAVVTFVLFAHGGTTVSVRAADSCNKECREDNKACLGAHTKLACKTNYDICIKHCNKSAK